MFLVGYIQTTSLVTRNYLLVTIYERFTITLFIYFSSVFDNCLSAGRANL